MNDQPDLFTQLVSIIRTDELYRLGVRAAKGDNQILSQAIAAELTKREFREAHTAGVDTL